MWNTAQANTNKETLARPFSLIILSTGKTNRFPTDNTEVQFTSHVGVAAKST